MKCPFCQQELVEIQFGEQRYWTCINDKCNESVGLGGNKKLWQELIHIHKTLEQSEICCTEWEKQALDYKAENIALSGELERTRKALDVAKEWLKEIQDKGEYVNPIELAESYLGEIEALEQKEEK